MNLSPYRLSMDCPWSLRKLARPAGLEPATLGLEGRCSIQLSYGRVGWNNLQCVKDLPTFASRAASGRRDGLTGGLCRICAGVDGLAASIRCIAARRSPF